MEYVINRKSGVRNQRGGVRNKSKSGVRNQRGGVRNKSKSGVRNGVRNNCRNPKSMVESQKLSKLSYGI